jgi:hypothetical protein
MLRQPKGCGSMTVAFLLLWLVLAFCVAAAANARGRNPIGWFLISVILSPLISLLLLIAFPVQAGGGAHNIDQELQRNIALGRSGSGRSVTPGKAVALTFVVAVLFLVGFYNFGRSIWDPDFRQSTERR